MNDDADYRIAGDLHLLPGTALPPGVSRGGGPPGHVLLTGATGFVGVYLLAALLDGTDAIIHCLMRAADRSGGLERLAMAMSRYGMDPGRLEGRVTIEIGDLSEVRCGLGGAQWNALAEDIDAIIHNGAHLNFVQPYGSLRKENVEATRWLLRLAAEAASDFTQISTVMAVTVAGGADRQGRDRLFETDPPPGFESLEGGYGQSKWVSERLVEMAAAAGLPTRILRVGPVIGDARKGHVPDEQVQQRLTAASVAAGLLPAPRGPIDLVPVEFIARATVGLLLARPRTVGVFHLVNPEPLTEPRLRSALAHLGLQLRIVSFDEWLAAMRQAVAADPTHPLATLVDNGSLASGVRELEYRLPVFDCTRTAQALAGTGIVCPPPDDSLLARLLLVGT